jgi:hypothetical protein
MHDVPRDVLSLVLVETVVAAVNTGGDSDSCGHGDPSAPGPCTIMEGGVSSESETSARMPVGLNGGMVGSSPKGKAAASWVIVSIEEFPNITARTLVFIQRFNTGEFIYVSDCCQC